MTATTSMRRRWAIDLTMLVAIGLLMGFLGPFASEHVPMPWRYVYWLICMVGGGLIGVVLDGALEQRIASTWRRTLLVSALMTPLVSLHVMTTEHLLLGGRFNWTGFWWLHRQVLPISLAVMVVRALVWIPRPHRVETRTVVEPPLPQAEATFRKRLA